MQPEICPSSGSGRFIVRLGTGNRYYCANCGSKVTVTMGRELGYIVIDDHPFVMTVESTIESMIMGWRDIKGIQERLGVYP